MHGDYVQYFMLPYIILCLLVLTYLNCRGVQATLNLNIVLTGIAFLTILALLFSTKFYSSSESLINLSGLTNGLPFGLLGILGAFQFGCWFYLGIEGNGSCCRKMSIYRTFSACRSDCGHDYINYWGYRDLVCLLRSVEVDTLGQSTYPLYDAAIATNKPLIINILFLGTILSCLTSANGCIADASGAWYSMARDTLIPKSFAKVHPKYKTPYRAILFLLPISVAFGFTGLLD